MRLILCNPQEITDIYNNHIKSDFPPAEVKPLSRILMLYEKSLYFVYAMYEENELLAYAFFSCAHDSEYVLLDYLAVTKNNRGAGIGTTALNLLKKEICKEYNGILLESENPDYAENDEDKAIRNRRISFYLKCGFETTKMTSRLFGVEYKIMVCSKASYSALSLTHSLSALYKALIAEKYMDTEVLLRVTD